MKIKPSAKVVAAVSAVLQYLEEERASAAARVEAPAPPPPMAPLWGVAGRQDAMLFRTLWQRRMSRSW